MGYLAVFQLFTFPSVTDLVLERVETVLGDPNAIGLLHLPLVPNDMEGPDSPFNGMNPGVVQADCCTGIHLLARFPDHPTWPTTRQHPLALRNPNATTAKNKRTVFDESDPCSVVDVEVRGNHRLLSEDLVGANVGNGEIKPEAAVAGESPSSLVFGLRK